MRRIVVLLLLLVAGMAHAHNGLEHVMGTVVKVSATSLDVKTVAGKTRTVTISATTSWVRGTTAVTLKDIKAGERVVIHARPVNGQLTAVEIAVGPVTAKQ